MEQILTDICDALNNWFTPDRSERYAGTYTIENGSIVLPEDVNIVNGQYFRVVNSRMNDGVYKYPANDMTDETFDGSVWAMRVPVRVAEIAAELAQQASEAAGGGGNGSFSPYVSESLTAGGYSYTRATNADGTPLDAYGAAWTAAMSKLMRWRKLP